MSCENIPNEGMDSPPKKKRKMSYIDEILNKGNPKKSNEEIRIEHQKKLKANLVKIESDKIERI
jgi:hypothetical protein